MLAKIIREVEELSCVTSQTSQFAKYKSSDITVLLGRAFKTATYEDGQAEDIVARTTYTMLGSVAKEMAPESSYDSTTYKYDFLGRLIEQKSPDEGTSKYMYDKAGRLRFMVDSLGLTTNPDTVLYWKYDVLGRVVEKGYIGGVNWGDAALQTNINNQSYPTTPSTWRKKYTYAVGGRLSSLLTNNDYDTTAEVEEYFTYDKYGNVTIKDIKVIDYNASTTYSTTYAYDLLGRVTQIDYPASGFGNVGVTYEYDRAGRVKRVGVPSSSNSFATYTYNAKVELYTETLSSAGAGVAQTRTFSYSTKGMLTQISNSKFTEISGTTNLDMVTFFHGIAGGITTDYNFTDAPSDYLQSLNYDKYGRLTQADASSSFPDQDIGVGSATTYNKNGNILSLKRGTAAAKTYTYQTGKNLIQSVGSWNYSAAVTGLLTSSGTNGVTTSITHDAFTQMPMRTVKSGTTTNLQYDGRKERGYQEVSGTKTLYLHGLNDFPLMLKQGSTEWAYVYGPTGLLVFRFEDSDWYLVLKDHLGSTRVVTDLEGAVVARYDYDPYGKIVGATVNQDVKYKFTGHESDSDGLWNFRARLYDDYIGLFYAVDPEKQDFSPLGYAGGNPVTRIDPTGRFWQDQMNSWESQMAGYYGGNALRADDWLAGFRWRYENGRYEIWVDGQWQGLTGLVEVMGYQWGPGKIEQWDPTMFERWSKSENIVGQASYSFFNNLYVFGQWINPFDEQVTHLDGGYLADGDQLNGLIEAGALLMPVSKGTSALKQLPAFTESTINAVTKWASRLRRGGQISEGARAIAKRLGRASSKGYSSAFSGVEPTTESAQKLIREILSDPTRVVYGNKTVDVYNMAGQGVRIDIQTNEFIGFLEASKATR